MIKATSFWSCGSCDNGRRYNRRQLFNHLLKAHRVEPPYPGKAAVKSVTHVDRQPDFSWHRTYDIAGIIIHEVTHRNRTPLFRCARTSTTLTHSDAGRETSQAQMEPPMGSSGSRAPSSPGSSTALPVMAATRKELHPRQKDGITSPSTPDPTDNPPAP